eukprot:COSAG01_NODE_34375_length_548_cov_5.465479_1_plen_65_part_10
MSVFQPLGSSRVRLNMIPSKYDERSQLPTMAEKRYPPNNLLREGTAAHSDSGGIIVFLGRYPRRP